MARTLMTRSQLELRRSIWDLRSRELEQFDLPNALQVSAREIVEGKRVDLDFHIAGKTCALSEVVEENLLRIGREAITNVIKHAEATRVTVHLTYDGDKATLVVSDNGRGFDPTDCPGSTEGHFGLSGMSERTKRIGGQISVRSTPGTGTSIEVSVPTRSPDQPAANPHFQ
jgi:signal transduction histidine kinase